MSYCLTVGRTCQEVESAPFFTKTFDSVEKFEAVNSLLQNRRRVGFPDSLFIPIRTNTIRNFCRDFFLPTFVDVALKGKTIAEKILLSIGSLLFDILTFPIRVLTAIPRCIRNAQYSKQNHPFYRYLIQNGVAPSYLSEDHVQVGVISVKERQTKAGKCLKDVTQSESTFNFIELPLDDSAWSSSYSDNRGLTNQEMQELFHHRGIVLSYLLKP